MSAKKTLTKSGKDAAADIVVSFASDSDDDDKSSSSSSSDSDADVTVSLPVGNSVVVETAPAVTVQPAAAAPPPVEEDEDDDGETVTFTLTLSTPAVSSSSSSQNVVANNIPKEDDVVIKTDDDAAADKSFSKTKSVIADEPEVKKKKKVTKTLKDVANGDENGGADAGDGSTTTTVKKKTTKTTTTKKTAKPDAAVNGSVEAAEEATGKTSKNGASKTATSDDTSSTTVKKKKSTKSASLTNGDGETATSTSAAAADETPTKVTKKKTKSSATDESKSKTTAEEAVEDAAKKSDEKQEESVEKPKKKKIVSRKTEAAAAAEEGDAAAGDDASGSAVKVVVKKKKVKKPTTGEDAEPLVVLRIDEPERDAVDKDVKVEELKPAAVDAAARQEAEPTVGVINVKQLDEVEETNVVEVSLNLDTPAEDKVKDEIGAVPYVDKASEESKVASEPIELGVKADESLKDVAAVEEKPAVAAATEASPAPRPQEDLAVVDGVEAVSVKTEEPSAKVEPIDVPAPSTAPDLPATAIAVEPVSSAPPSELVASLPTVSAEPTTDEIKDEKSLTTIVVTSSEGAPDTVENRPEIVDSGSGVGRSLGDSLLPDKAPSIDEKSRENEESDFSYRRKSMDDFIKRILAEAREEQQKRMGTTASSTTGQPTDVAALDAPKVDVDAPRYGVGDKSWIQLGDDKDQSSMLDRRLTATDRTSKKATATDDLDEDLAEIGRFISKRSTTSTKYDADLDTTIDDLASGIRRRATTRQSDGVDDDIGVVRKLGALNDDGYVSRQRQQQQDGAHEESFVPRARDETADLVRSSVRPVRQVIDQQTDVVQQLKSTSRSMDDLENEIRQLRETLLDRQARIETMRSAIDAESRLYEADQNAASERIRQQRIPGGRFVRDEFMASVGVRPAGASSSSLTAASLQLIGGDDAGGSGGLRRRSGSVSSAGGYPFGPDSDYRSTAASRVSRQQPDAASSTSTWRRPDLVDDDASSTASGYSTRRAGSVTRDRSFNIDELLAGTTRTSSYSSRQYERSPGPYGSAASANDDYSSSRPAGLTTLSSLGYGSGSGSYLSTDYRPSTYSSSYSSYGSGTDRPSYYSGYSSTSASSYSPDPNRFRRAQSVSESSYERPSNYNRNSTSIGSSFVSSSAGGGDFQSRFLDKVRTKKALGDDASQRASESRQFKSRFLRN